MPRRSRKGYTHSGIRHRSPTRRVASEDSLPERFRGKAELKRNPFDRPGVGSARGAYAVTILAALAFFAVGVVLLGFGVVQESAVSSLHLSISDTGLLVHAFFITYALLQVPGGYFAD